MVRFPWLLALASDVAATNGTIRLRNGVEMPQVSLGTAQWDNATVEEAVVLAVELGMKGVDTAFNYWNQGGVGKGLKRVDRSEVFVTTKTRDCFNNHIALEDCEDYTRGQVESDLAQLDIEQIDLLLLHGANHNGQGPCDDAACQLNVAQWKVYESFYKAGKARAIGVSNYCPSCLDCLLAEATVQPAVNQIKFHVGMTADPQGLMSYCEQHGIVPMAYSPMGSGAIFGDPLCHEIGIAHGKTGAQVGLKWIIDKGYTLATKTNSREHLTEDLDLFAWELEDDEKKLLDAYFNSTDVPSWACTAMSTAV